MKYKVYLSLGIMLVMLGCAEHDDGLDNNQQILQINICSTYPTADLETRAESNGGFVSGDEMGVFVVDYDENGRQGTMSLQGNRASNIRFTMQDDGTWTAASQLYWDVKGKHADFFGYYPFNGNLSSIEAQPFSVSDKQNAEATATSVSNYCSSDLLWASSLDVAPTTETIPLRLKHIMAGVTIHLEAGSGFTNEEWVSLDKTVFLAHTVLDGTIDMRTGTPTVGAGTARPITPMFLNEDWRAIVFPQTVAANKDLLVITIDGQNYSLKKNEAMNFVSGKMHQFTVTVNRKEASGTYECKLADEAIVPWQDDTYLHEGLVRQYVIVQVDETGELEHKMQQHFADLSSVKNLKISGPLNNDDLDWLWHNVPKLQCLNIQNVTIESGILNGPFFQGSRYPLESIIYPKESVKEITGFVGCALKGSLIIPEGVERIGGFMDTRLNGTVSLPSTLKYMYGLCQYNEDLHGELIIPEAIVEWNYIGGNFTGTLNLPKGLKKIGSIPSGMTGTINIPQGCEVEQSAFYGSQCTALVLPEGMKEIPNAVFMSSEIRGEVLIPSTVEVIRESAFAGSKISRVIFSENLKRLEYGAFAGCTRLSGTITIPKKIVRIPANCFRNCMMLTGLVLHKDVYYIDEFAFAQCNNLTSIVCESEEPPLLHDNAFLGVPKDNFTIEVPKGCVEKYRQARGWSEFKRIAEYSNFVCRPAHVCALNNAHQEDLVLNADGAWTVTDYPDWVTLSVTSGTGKTSVKLTFQPLAHGAGNRSGTITFAMQNYTTSCEVNQYDYEYEEDGCLTLQKATKGNRGGIDIVFVGDGYDGLTISDGTYLDLVRYQTECFFAIEPYKSMRNYFNVYVTFPLSQEKGVNTMNTYVNNRFGTLQGISSILSLPELLCTSSQLIIEADEVQQYVVDNTPVEEDNFWRTLVIAVPNSTEYEGNTVFQWNGLAISICPPSDQSYPRDTRGTIQHEAGGHGFGKLGDERVVMNRFAPNNVKLDIEEMHRVGWYANLATTGKLSQVPWAEFIFDTDYSDYVDVYEGGYGYTRGIYRPEVNSCMNYGIPYYNTPSRLAIYRRIKEYADESWSMDEFRAQDTFEWGPTNVTRANEKDLEGLVPYANGNHIQPRIVDFKRIGDEVRNIRLKLKNERINK